MGLLSASSSTSEGQVHEGLGNFIYGGTDSLNAFLNGFEVDADLLGDFASGTGDYETIIGML